MYASASPALKGYAWGLFAISIWVSWMVATRGGAKSSLDTFDLAALRFASAGLILLPVGLKYGLDPRRIGWGVWTALVCGAGIVYALLSAVGFWYAPISHGSVMLPGTMPMFVAILSVLILGERIAGPRRVGFVLIPMGVIVLVFAGAHHGTGGEWVGQLFFVGAAILWASYTIALRKSGLAPLHGAAIVCVWSALLYLPPYALYAWSTGGAGLARASWAEIAGQTMIQGVLSSVVALYAYNRAIAILGSSRGAALGSLVPVLATLSAIPLLGEWPAGTDWLGLAAITLGVYLATGAPLPRWIKGRGPS